METIDPAKLLTQITPVLDKLRIPYFVTGGFAVSVWGRPRATFDIDIVVKMKEPEANKLVEMLREISKFGYIDEDTTREAIRNNGEFNFIDPETGIKADFWVAKEGKDSEKEFNHRKAKEIDGQRVYFISPEDLILSKLRWQKMDPSSSRHIEDIKSVLKISGDILDKKYLKEQAMELDVEDELGKLL